jgi:ABC-type multidrug transport system fused ATPase/permease subunit
VLFLDEPTSNLDPQTEALVHERNSHLFRDACVVSSVHRPHLLSRFDEVVFMEQGRIIDVGTVSDLKERHPAFCPGRRYSANHRGNGRVFLS